MKRYDKVIILIPAYMPTDELITLTENLLKEFSKIVVIDDGSGNKYKKVFNCLPQDVITLKHEENKGKGRALKTGLKYIYDNFKDATGVITCDADGQHKTDDIAKIASTLIENTSSLILGSRKFDKDVPLRSAFGNAVTRAVYFLASRLRIYDTQTGLRAFSYDMLPILMEIPGERYEYEINMLLEFSKRKIKIQEIEIKTVYIDNNSSSHFNTIKDSIIIYSNILKFSFSSLISFVIDFIALFLFQYLTKGINYKISLLISVVCARIISSFINFNLNKKVVFKKNSNNSLLKYYTLALWILGMNYCLLYLLNILIYIPLFYSKIITEITLFMISYMIQKHLIFNKN